MKKIFSIVAAGILFLSSAVAGAMEIQNGGYVEVEAIQYYIEGKSLNELRTMAERRAFAALIEEIGDLKISADVDMHNENLDQTIKTQVEKTVRGAKMSVTRDAENNFTAKVRLNLYGGQNSVANIIVPKDNPVAPFPQFAPKFLTMDTNYTGLIIDCGGQLESTAVLPKIVSASGKEIYAFQYLDRNTVVSRGMVNYAESSTAGVQRAGSNPLTVQAVAVLDCDVMISDEDADKILAANSKSNFLKNCMVVFVK